MTRLLFIMAPCYKVLPGIVFLSKAGQRVCVCVCVSACVCACVCGAQMSVCAVARSRQCQMLKLLIPPY